jgi:hypothetical protein
MFCGTLFLLVALTVQPQPAVQAKVVVIPFVLVEEFASPPDSKRVVRSTIARRADGSTARMGYAGPTELGLTGRSISFIDGTGVTVSDSLGMKITHPVLVGEALDQFRGSIFYPPDNCVMSAREKLLGFREISGERVAIVTMSPRPSPRDPANTMRITESRAIDLACENLGYSIEEESHVDGSQKLMTKGWLVNLTLGDPDPSFFKVSPTLTEVTQSQFDERIEQIVIKALRKK